MSQEASIPFTPLSMATNSMPITPNPTAPSLKRAASTSFEGLEESGRKRLKEDHTIPDEECPGSASLDAPTDSLDLVEGLAQELQCGCCSALVYRPVIVTPCQHFFCGSCCVLWIKNGGSNCPSCRGQSTIVTPFRALQPVIDLLLRHAPHMSRSNNEQRQADEIYKAGQSMRLPSPREASPEPNVTQSADLARPCPHCQPGNPFGWMCPQPIPDPAVDPDNAWHLDNGTPPGHAHCGNCENLLALRSPSTTKCDLCQVHFCGVSVPGRCVAAPLLAQHPHGMSDIGDLILSSDVYECFDSNTVEVEIMLDYLSAQRLNPRHVYREIVSYIQSQARGFTPLIDLDLFTDLHAVTPGVDLDPDAPRNRICRLCATEVLLWGLKEWWVRERQKGFLEGEVMNRSDCPDGSNCTRQKDLAHAREFNHIFGAQPRPATPDRAVDDAQLASGRSPHPADEESIPETESPHDEIEDTIETYTDPIPTELTRIPPPLAFARLFSSSMSVPTERPSPSSELFDPLSGLA
ncbi:hypothetical protein BDN72DRAFT_841547 [Pluteus cervinus]|uniref:Uncharacterized protein n=1 Tax=Pluteus cervinus TaxID=181527 RepID=A0ACD3ASH5_9AGAR|nr:hypothetical protein BDN72DRAFT_841547 [Pluteus cervinus]